MGSTDILGIVSLITHFTYLLVFSLQSLGRAALIITLTSRSQCVAPCTICMQHSLQVLASKQPQPLGGPYDTQHQSPRRTFLNESNRYANALSNSWPACSPCTYSHTPALTYTKEFEAVPTMNNCNHYLTLSPSTHTSDLLIQT